MSKSVLLLIATTVALGSPLVWSAVKTKNLLLGFRFEEASGNATDFSGNGFTGTAIGTTIVAGHNGRGRSFNGTTSDKINVADNASLRPTSAYTVSAWVKLAAAPSAGGVMVIAEKDDASSNMNYGFGVSNADGNYCASTGWWFGFQESSAATHVACYTAALTTGVWNHLAGTWDGTNLKLYLNGVLQATAGAAGKTPTSGTGLLVVGNEAGLPFYWNGTMDEIRLYNRALSAAEVRSLMLGYEPGEF